jgi:hypothetical protein
MMAALVPNSSMPDSDYLCFDQDQWEYQSLLQISGRARQSSHLRALQPNKHSLLNKMDDLVFPIPYSSFVVSSIIEATDQLSLVARDVRNGIYNVSNSYYSSIRSAIELLSTALVLLEYRKIEDRCKIMLSIYSEDYYREKQHLERLIDRKIPQYPDYRMLQIEAGARDANERLLSKIESSFQNLRSHLTQKYPNELSSFKWESKTSVTKITEYADEVLIKKGENSSPSHNKIVVCGTTQSVWGICSGQVHGKVWSSKTLSSLTKDSGWINRGNDGWVEVEFVNSKPNMNMLCKVLEFTVQLQDVVLDSFYRKV